jgi:3-dehydroquinate synthase
MIKNELIIKSSQGDYPVIFLESISNLRQEDKLNQSFIIVDKNVLQIYGKKLSKILTRPYFVVEPTEEFKSLEGVGKIVEWLIDNGAIKSSQIIAIGGGITQDLATFVSHIYYRGIRWVYLPTTLLSQSDSCIGAKCAVNLKGHKNQLGVIHSPSEVVIVEEFLSTLAEVDFRSGFGEIFKLSVTGSRQFFSQLKEHLKQNGLQNKNMLGIIRSSLISKQEVIELDEYEKDLRRVLNYGHTFGHALESISKHTIPHGIAILFGMDLINYLGVSWNITNQEFYTQFRNIIKEYYKDLTFEVNLETKELIKEILRDKKMYDGYMYFAVPKNIGEIVIIKKIIDEELQIKVKEYLDNESIFNFS